MNEQDRRAVEGMARCGIELDGLISAFPKFTASEITTIYYEVHKSDDKAEDVKISINCS